MMNNIPKPNKDRALAMLMGAALGDALGAPHEFRHSQQEYTGRLDRETVVRSRWHGERRSVPGQVTDDTEMTIALLRAITNTRGTHYENGVIDAYLTWANSKTPFMGRNTRALFAGVKTYDGYRNRYRKVTQENGNNQSNGALMRASPLALMADYHIGAISDCRISNPNKICCDVNLIYVSMLAYAVRHPVDVQLVVGALLGIAEANLRSMAEGPPKEIIKAALYDPNPGVMCAVDGKDKGWCVYGLAIAIRAVRIATGHPSATPFGDTLRWVIELGGDTDTNACIAGALLGAVYGPWLMQEQAENIAIMKSANTSVGDVPRPAEYHPAQIPELLDRLFPPSQTARSQ